VRTFIATERESMQFAKDSFFVALQERLAGLNPARVVTVSGATVPGVVVPENLPPSYEEAEANTFYIQWGAAEVCPGRGWDCGLISVDVEIWYYSVGSVASMVDRGRLLGQLDAELMSICQPPNTEKRDYTRSPSSDLGTRVFWNQPMLSVAHSGGSSGKSASVAQACEGTRVGRTARLKIYFFPEVKFS
jgi:hypothetical protein